jgi:hypothetical protein
MDRQWATSSQYNDLCRQICALLNRSRHARRSPISTSTRLSLLDFLINLRPSQENRFHQLDLRTYHIINRILNEITEELNVGDRHYLQDVLRWTVDCHRERIWSRLRGYQGGGGRSLVRREPDRHSTRCYRCNRIGTSPRDADCRSPNCGLSGRRSFSVCLVLTCFNGSLLKGL